MFKSFALLLMLILPPQSLAQSNDERMLSLATQDMNDLYFLTIIATRQSVKASLLEMPPRKDGGSTVVEYPRDLFERLWSRAMTLPADLEAPEGTEDIQASRNYVIAVDANNHPGADSIKTYLLPKCSIDAELQSFVLELANDLLPKGSPGLFSPCPTSTAEG